MTYVKNISIIYLLILLLLTGLSCQDINRKKVPEYEKSVEEQPVDSISIIAGILQNEVTNNPEWNPQAVRYGYEDWMITPPVNFILGWKTEKDSILVWLAVNTEEIIAGFRDEIINSPLIRFRKSSPRIPLAEHYSSDYIDGFSYGYELKLSQNIFTLPLPDTLTATIYNNTDIDTTTGSRYWIDYNNNGVWEVVDFIFGNGAGMGYPDIGYSLLSHSKHKYTISLYPDLYDYQPGEYRVRRSFLIQGHYTEKGQSRIWNNYYVTARFTIQ